MSRIRHAHKFKLIAAIGAFAFSIPIKTQAEEILTNEKTLDEAQPHEENESNQNTYKTKEEGALESFYYSIVKAESLLEAFELVTDGLHKYPNDTKLQEINSEIQKDLLAEAEELILEENITDANTIYEKLLASPFMVNSVEKTVLTHQSAIEDFEGSVYLNLDNTSLFDVIYESLKDEEMNELLDSETFNNYELINVINPEVNLDETYVTIDHEDFFELLIQIEDFIVTSYSLGKLNETVENEELEEAEVLEDSAESEELEVSENSEKSEETDESEVLEDTEKIEEADELVETEEAVDSNELDEDTEIDADDNDEEAAEDEEDLSLFEEETADEENQEDDTDAEESDLEEESVISEDLEEMENASSELDESDALTDEEDTDLDVKDEEPMMSAFSMMTTSSVTNTNERDELYEEAMRAFDLFDRWNASLKGIQSYPGDEGFSTALNRAAQRLMNWGYDRLNRGNEASARYYFELVSNEPNVSSAIRNEALNVLDEMNASQRDALYEEAMRAFDLFDRWNASLEGIQRFPGDEGFTTALNRAGQRLMNWGYDRLNRGNEASARFYFDLIAGEPNVSASLRNEAQTVIRDVYGPNRDELYEEAMRAFDLFDRWNASLKGIQRFPGDEGFTTALNRAGQRLMNWGYDRLNRGNESSARFYFELIANEPNVSQALRTEANDILRKMDGPDRDELYEEAMRAFDLFDRWNASLKGIEHFPGDEGFTTALNRAGQRLMNWGYDRLNRGNESSARFYFELIVNEPNVSQALRTEASGVLKEMDGPDRDELYEEAMRAFDLFDRWNASLKGIEKFPGDSGFTTALDRAAVRLINWGIARHDNKNYSGAAYYYNLVKNESNVSSSIRQTAQGHLDRIDTDRSNDLYSEITDSQNVFVRFNAAAEGVREFPGEQRFKDALDKSANEILEAGRQKHKNRDFSGAVEYYEFLLEDSNTPNHLLEQVEDYVNLARNNISLVNYSYRTTHYNSTLIQALDRQMNFNPQTDSYGGGWQTARRSDVEYHLNPDNFIHFDIDKTNTTQVKVTASSLNVRTGPGTNHSQITSVQSGEVYSVISQSNGWYQIQLSGRTGWVSGNFVEVQTQTKQFDSQNITGTVNTSVLNVRSGPGTNHSVVRQVTLGQRFTIIDEKDGWFEMRLNGQTGWVSRDFVTVSQEIPRNILQFLLLSGTSGISEEDMNRELRGKGILEGQGAAFIEASRKHNVNEIYLLAHALLETGHGTSRLATGVEVSSVNGQTVPTKTVYNMYGIAAFDNSPLKSGSEYAYQQGWDTPEKAIIDGAKWISERYINHSTYKQDTLYKMRWNPETPGAHQYATDIGWAVKQTHTLDLLVEMSNKYNLTLQFDIPVYR